MGNVIYFVGNTSLNIYFTVNSHFTNISHTAKRSEPTTAPKAELTALVHHNINRLHKGSLSCWGSSVDRAAWQRAGYEPVIFVCSHGGWIQITCCSASLKHYLYSRRESRAAQGLFTTRSAASSFAATCRPWVSMSAARFISLTALPRHDITPFFSKYFRRRQLLTELSTGTVFQILVKVKPCHTCTFPTCELMLHTDLQPCVSSASFCILSLIHSLIKSNCYKGNLLKIHPICKLLFAQAPLLYLVKNTSNLLLLIVEILLWEAYKRFSVFFNKLYTNKISHHTLESWAFIQLVNVLFWICSCSTVEETDKKL